MRRRGRAASLNEAEPVSAAPAAASPAVDNITTILIFAAIFLKLRNARGLMGNCAATESRYAAHALFWMNANNVATEGRSWLRPESASRF